MQVLLALRSKRGTALMWDTDTGIVYLSGAYMPDHIDIRWATMLTMEDTRWYDKVKEDPAFQMLALVFDTRLPW